MNTLTPATIVADGVRTNEDRRDHVQSSGNWIVTPASTIWLPAPDINQAIMITGTVLTFVLLTLKVFMSHR